MFEEDFEPFFNPDEFAVAVTICGKTIYGLLTRAYETLSDDPSHHMILVCSERSIDFVTAHDHVIIENRRYQIIGMEYEGTGLAKLTLNAVGKI